MKIIGVDPGSERSGVIVLDEGIIIECFEDMSNAKVLEFVSQFLLYLPGAHVVIEDFIGGGPVGKDKIKTVKFIGVLEHRLTDIGQPFTSIPRWEVKKWVFLQFRTMAEPEIIKIIARNQARNEKKAIAAGEEYKKRNLAPTFIYVEDRIVANAMRKWWDIEKPSRPGQKSPYGLKTHSWQALGLVSYWMATMGLKINKTN